MDNEIEEIHHLLRNINLPSTIRDLKNPTEEFVINLIVAFLTWLKIDVTAITKPSYEQQSIMSSIEDTDIVSIINLHAAISQIFDRIYVKNFVISDITNCGSKKVCKFARYVANFIFYITNKESDLEEIINEIRGKTKKMEELNELKKARIALHNEKALKITKQLSLKEKYKMEIRKMHSILEDNETKNLELQEEIIAYEEKRKTILENFNAYKLETQRNDKTITELKLEIVSSPEEYNTRLYNLEEQNKEKIEEREKMQETFLAKTELLKKYDNLLSFVQKQYEKFYEIKDTYKNLKKAEIQEENIIKKVAMMANDIAKCIETHKLEEDNKGSTIDEIYVQTEERLNAIRELQVKLMSEAKLAVVKLDENKLLYNDAFMEKNKIQDLIEKTIEVTSAFIKNCQELYNNEVQNEIELQKCFDKAWE